MEFDDPNLLLAMNLWTSFLKPWRSALLSTYSEEVATSTIHSDDEWQIWGLSFTQYKSVSHRYTWNWYHGKISDWYIYVLRDRSYLNIMKDIQEVSNLLLNFSTDGDTMCGQLIRSREAIVLLWQRRTQTTICLHNFRTLHLMFLLSVAFIERSGQIVTVCCANLRSALLFSPKYVSNKFYPIYRPIVHQHCKEVAYVWAGQLKWADSHGQCLESILFNPCIVWEN